MNRNQTLKSEPGFFDCPIRPGQQTRTRLLTAGLLAAIFTAPAVLAQVFPIGIPDVRDPRLEGLSIPPGAEQVGLWSQVFDWPLVAIHTTLLPDGSVLSYGTPPGQNKQDGRIFDIWDPRSTGNGHHTLPNSQTVNSFCSAGVLQPFGEMLISGGNEPFESTLFDHRSGSATTVESKLASPRWYATMTLLADGRSLISGGEQPYETAVYENPDANLDKVSMTPEVYTPGLGWQSLSGATSREAFGPDYNRFFYPRQWVAPNGEVFGISSEKMWYLNPNGNGGIRIVGTFKTPVSNLSRPNIGPTSTAVMYDVGKILQVGGNGYTNGFNSFSSSDATRFDINGGDPVITELSPMHQARQWANSIVLPNGRVLVTGGTRFADNGNPFAVFSAEVWDPETGSWSELSSAQVVRNYHSNTVLLPNGSILSAGGGVPGPVTNFNAEIFYPPYFFENTDGQTVLADRPRFLSMSASRLAHGSPIQLELSDTREIDRIALIGLSSTTHSFNMGQRFYPANFSQDGAILTVDTPANPALAPPGYYLIFALDAAGRPSPGSIIALGSAQCEIDPQCDDGDSCTDDLCTDGVCSHRANGTCSTGSEVTALYPFDEGQGTVAADAGGKGNDASLFGAGWTAGRIGNAVDIDGGSQFVDLPDGIVQDCDDLTVAAWVRLDSNPTWGRIFDFGNDTGTNLFLTPAANNPSTLRFALKVPGIHDGLEAQISYAYSFPIGVWTHVAVVLEGNLGTLYVDGLPVAANSNMLANPSDMGATLNNFLGDSQYSADPTLDGAIDELEIACRAYSAQEITDRAAGIR